MIPDDAMVTRLTGELDALLTREGLVEGVNLLPTRQDDWLLVQLMAVSVKALGVLLASLPTPKNSMTGAASRAVSRTVRHAGRQTTGGKNWSLRDIPSTAASCSWQGFGSQFAT